MRDLAAELEPPDALPEEDPELLPVLEPLEVPALPVLADEPELPELPLESLELPESLGAPVVPLPAATTPLAGELMLVVAPDEVEV